jgi:nicotinic acid phosphoribosyltransferase
MPPVKLTIDLKPISFSIPAAEHSTITSWGQTGEREAFENMLTQYPTGLVAVGSTIADALQLSAVWNTLTTSSASTGVILPPTEVGAMIGLRNDSGQTITVYPKSGSTINAGASTLSVATAKTVILFATSATTWASVLTA